LRENTKEEKRRRKVEVYAKILEESKRIAAKVEARKKII